MPLFHCKTYRQLVHKMSLFSRRWHPNNLEGQLFGSLVKTRPSQSQMARCSGEAAVIFFRGVINGLLQLTTRLAACRRFPVIVLDQQRARQGGKASSVIGSRKNESEAERNVLLFYRPLCRANSIRRKKWRGYPGQLFVRLFWLKDLGASALSIKTCS